MAFMSASRIATRGTDQRSSLRTPSMIDSRVRCLCENVIASSAARGRNERISAESSRRSIRSGKAPRLYPGIREPSEPVLAEKKQSADSRHLTALVLRDDAQSGPCLGSHLTVRRKRLGSSSEVDGFRLEVRDGLLVERVHPV